MEHTVVTKPTADTPAHLTNARPKDERPKGINSGPVGGDLGLGILNERQEKFAHFLAMGKTQSEAAILAGYSGHGANASRLANIPAIQEKVEQLRLVYQSQSMVKIETAKAEIERLIEKEGLDLAYFVKEYRHNLELARNDGDIRAANDCLAHMARMLGFMKSKDESPDSGKKNDSNTRPQVAIKIENNGAQSVGGNPRIVVEDGETVVDGFVVEAPEDVS